MESSPGRKYWGSILVTLGVTFAAAGLTFWFAWGFPESSTVNRVVLGIVVHVLFGYIVVMSGVAIYDSDLAVEDCWIAAKWCFGGFAFMTALVVWGSLPDLGESRITLQFVNRVIVVGSVGAAAGVLIGLNRGQAARNERLAEQTDDQRETLRFVLQLLRHDLKNDLTTIDGYADLLERSLDDETDREYLGHIDDRTDAMRDLLETAGAIVQSETGRGSLEEVNLSVALRELASHTDATCPDVDVETDVDDGLVVRADGLVDELFRNLLENAVAHNPTDDPTVTITARAVGGDGGVVEVVIADDGAGIPESIRERAFEAGVHGRDSDGEGLGLYLVRKLASAYDASIDVDSSATGGTAITVRFPAA